MFQIVSPYLFFDEKQLLDRSHLVSLNFVKNVQRFKKSCSEAMKLTWMENDQLVLVFEERIGGRNCK